MNLEKKLSEKIKTEEKMKQEIESLKRQLKFYKDKLQLEVNVRKTIQAAKKNTKSTNINTLNCDDSHKSDSRVEKEKEATKSDPKIITSNKNLKSTVIDIGKTHHFEITVNKFKNDEERLSDNSKKQRKNVLYDEMEDCLNSINNEDKDMNNMNNKNNNSNKCVQSQSPSKILNLNLTSTHNNKVKQVNSVRLSNQKKNTKEVKLLTSGHGKYSEQHKEKIANNEKSKVDIIEVKEILNNIYDNIDNELEELMELENQLLKIKNGIEPFKLELKTDPDKSIDFESSPTNKKQKLTIKNTIFNQKQTLQSVTIDLNTTNGYKK